MSESFAELLNEYSLSIQTGDLVNATVVDIKREYIYLDLGFKSSCVVPKQEFLDYNGKCSLNIGDEVEVLVEELEDGFGSSVLSREKAKEISAWEKIKKALKENSTIEAFVTNSVRGGLIVDISKVQGFLPTSLVDINQTRDLSVYENQLIEVKIVKIDEEKRTVLVSRKAALQPENFNPEEVMKNLVVGNTVEGVVKNVTDYGAFVDLGGVDGLLHITDMSWNRIESPRDLFKNGQRLKLKVTRCDQESKKVSLSLKELNMKPWTDIVDNYKENDSIKGKVSKINDLGVFVMLESGIEGLIFNTEIDWTDKTPSASNKLSIGDVVETKILEIDDSKYRISLSLKRMIKNPWKEFEKNTKEGDKISGKVKNVTDFGVFVEINSGLSGVVTEELLSWSPVKDGSAPIYEIGDDIEAVVKNIDSDKEKILLSVRDLTADPVAAYENANPLGSLVEGVITDVSTKNITVKLSEGVYGLIRHLESGIGDVSLKEIFSEGDTIKAKIIGSSTPSNRYLKLSIKDLVNNVDNIKNNALKEAFIKAKE